MGISELEDDALKTLKAYGFTKYHQKLFKDTDYLFLDDYIAQIDENKKKIGSLEGDLLGSMAEPYRKAIRNQLNEIEKKQSLDLRFSIWGHSLDISDKDYIVALFSLNDELDRNIRITVYYFDKFAKFSLLNNLLAILGKDKVERWMKKGWLKFEPNPEIDFGLEAKDEQIEEAS